MAERKGKASDWLSNFVSSTNKAIVVNDSEL